MKSIDTLVCETINEGDARLARMKQQLDALFEEAIREGKKVLICKNGQHIFFKDGVSVDWEPEVILKPHKTVYYWLDEEPDEEIYERFMKKGS